MTDQVRRPHSYANANAQRTTHAHIVVAQMHGMAAAVQRLSERSMAATLDVCVCVRTRHKCFVDLYTHTHTHNNTIAMY